MYPDRETVYFKTMKKNPLTLLLATLLCFTAHAQSVLRMEGSDLLKPAIKEALNADWMTQHIDTDILDIDLKGSVLALDAMRDGVPDITLIASPEDRMLDAAGYKSFPLCYMIGVIAVNESNPMPDITLAQLGDLLDANLGLKTWSDLGLSGALASRNIKIVTYEGGHGMALEMVKYMALKDRDMRSSVETLPSMENVLQALRVEPNTLAIVPRNIRSDEVKVLPVSGGSSGQGDYAFGPSEDNVNFGDYPLRLKFYLCIREENLPMMLGFLKSLYSKDMAQVFENQYITPVSRRDRERIILELDNL